MARSYSIYILREVKTSILLGAWTVKHEMLTYVNSFEVTRCWLEENWQVWRFRDNQPDKKDLIPWEDLL